MSVPGGAPARAAAVVIGAGAFGAATAYHLARRGLDVALLDQHALGSQTSPRAAGLTSQADRLPVLARLRREACDAFARFEEEMGRSVGYHRSGSLRAAYTETGEARVREGLATAQALGIPAALISPAEAQGLAPHFIAGTPRAILHVPDDGWLDPARLAVAYAARAAELGARAMPFTRVTGLLAEGGRAAGVATDRGEIHAPVVVDAAGAWTARVAAGAGLRVPLVPVRHQLLVTEPIPGVAPLQPSFEWSRPASTSDTSRAASSSAVTRTPRGWWTRRRCPRPSRSPISRSTLPCCARSSTRSATTSPPCAPRAWPFIAVGCPP
jgi:glycine/D-amino acid oxidase-like deaminating enzyme